MKKELFFLKPIQKNGRRIFLTWPFFISLLIISLSFASLVWAQTWVEPTQTPPAGQLSGPVWLQTSAPSSTSYQSGVFYLQPAGGVTTSYLQGMLVVGAKYDGSNWTYQTLTGANQNIIYVASSSSSTAGNLLKIEYDCSAGSCTPALAVIGAGTGKGNVGIGTTSPGSSLTVRRSTAGTALAVRNTGDTADTFTIDNTGTVTAGSVPWARLTSFPTGCGANQAVQVIGTTLTCISVGAGGGGTVTSVGLAMPAQFSVSGSPVTTSGTLTASWNSQSANTVLAAPNGSAGVPIFRALVAADIPNLDASKITSGVFGVTRGGTGQSATSKGEILYADSENSWARLGIGSNGQVLTVSSNVPTWASASGGVTWPLLAPDGTKEAPSYSFSNSSGTGMFRPPEANNLAFVAGGNEAIRIDSSGKVGIGTSSPSVKLHVHEASTSLSGALINTQATSSSYYALNVQSGGTSRLYVRADGNVGIGTTSPGAPLHVVGSTFPVGTIERATTETSTLRTTFLALHSTSGTIADGFGPTISFGIQDATTGGIKEIAEIGAFREGGNTQGGLVFRPKSGGTYFERMRITKDGKVGIGTTTIGSLLQVNGNAAIGYSASTAAPSNGLAVSGDVGIGTASPGTKLDVNGVVTGRDNATFGYISGSSGGIYLTKTVQYGKPAVQAVTSGFAAETLSLNPVGGDVGIGTASPAQRLEVTAPSGTTSRLRITDTDTNENPELQLKYGTGANDHWAIYVDKTNNNRLTFWNGTNLMTLNTSGKLSVTEVDPIYEIDGIKYATYGHSTIGLKEETVGKIKLFLMSNVKAQMSNQSQNPNDQIYLAILNFDQQEKDSDLWLFRQITAFGENWQDLVVNLTPEGRAETWYELLPKENKLVIYGTSPISVSYRLIAPRYDWPGRATNLASDQNISGLKVR